MANVSDHRPGSLATITELDNIGSLHRKVTIATLSGDVLLENFDFCLDKNEEIDPWYANYEEDQKCPYGAWYALVCQR